MSDPAQRIIGLYDDKADGWIADRGRTLGRGGPVLDEAAALERFAKALPPGGAVLDVGCGSGWPWGAALLDRGFRVTGVDASPRLIAHAAESLPAGEWIVGDMRSFDLGRTFDGLLVWYSLFHLTPDDQRTALARILAHASPKAALLMTAGWGEAGVSIGEWRGEPLYHASLAVQAYDAILDRAGFSIECWPDELELSRVRLARRAFLSAE
jgi:SAM-dependent methyltransferase